MAFEPPQRLVRALGETQHEGNGAAAWLARLPELVQEAVTRHGATVERVHLPGGRSSLVVLVTQADGTPAVLKLAPRVAAPHVEAAALRQWDGWGACRLLDAEEPGIDGTDRDAGAGGVLLLERLHPEVSLRSLPQAKALLEAADTLRKLWVQPPQDVDFETVAERTARQADAMAAVAPEQAGPLVEAALTIRTELLAHPPETLLLHGCYRQGKVLAGERTPWLAVGPDPVVGERAYDLARMGLDRIEDLVGASTSSSSARRRLGRIADSLDVDRERLLGWTVFRAVLGGVTALSVGHRQEGESLLEYAGWL